MIINEFLPNPVGKDTDAEWIELFNNGESEINLSDWQLKDASGKTFIFPKEIRIRPGDYAIFNYKTTKISLNNDGETLFLYDRSGNLIDKAEYVGTAPEGKSLIRQGNNFVFASQPTPGKENISVLNAEEKPVSENLINQNSAIVYNSGRLPGANFILLGLGIALFLALASILIIKKLDLNNE
ncbi:MAG: lamin tail domain-containing protein [Patescibacteria group bacterium]